MAARVYPAAPQAAHMQAPPNWGALLNEVGLSADDFYHQIVGAVERGSGALVLAWDDFEFEINSTYNEREHLTTLELIQHGMKPLDAIVWMNGKDRPHSLAITVRDAEDDEALNMGAIFSGFFCWYFSIFTQGTHIGAGDPKFILNVLNLGAHWKSLVNNLSSADIAKFPISWVQNVDINRLSDKSKNRLALGAAGHRYPSALKYIRPEDFRDGTDNAKAFIGGIRRWTQDLCWWDLHPAVKSGAVITVTGSLNGLIEDCLSKSVKQVRLETLVQAKILNHMPEEKPTHANWDGFNLGLLPRLVHKIFD
jgi:hypothetical protein